jgi:hypothetical protein
MRHCSEAWGLPGEVWWWPLSRRGLSRNRGGLARGHGGMQESRRRVSLPPQRPWWAGEADYQLWVAPLPSGARFALLKATLAVGCKPS